MTKPSWQEYDAMEKTIVNQDAEIARLREQIERMRCCGNCKWDLDLYEENCHGCCEKILQKWELAI